MFACATRSRLGVQIGSFVYSADTGAGAGVPPLRTSAG